MVDGLLPPLLNEMFDDFFTLKCLVFPKVQIEVARQLA